MYDRVMAFGYALLAAQQLKQKQMNKEIKLQDVIFHPLFLSAEIYGGSFPLNTPQDFYTPIQRMYRVKMKSERKVIPVYEIAVRNTIKYYDIFNREVQGEYYYFMVFEGGTSRIVVHLADDGIGLYLGDKYWHVNKDFKAFEATILSPIFNRDYSVPLFARKEAADKYIADNKPKYSEIQFKAHCKEEYNKGRRDERMLQQQPLPKHGQEIA